MHTGILYIVATPIGNLEDMTQRAIKTLQQVDLIAAEDTRHSKKLLQHFNITTPMLAAHDYNERNISEKILKLLQEGKSIALISDAGTPLISDPGYHLVSAVRAANMQVVPIPGACAAIAALSAAGLPSDRFVFEGFLPAKSSQRRTHLATLENETRTLIFYEAPHRIAELLEDLVIVFGETRLAVIARELTKTYETILSGNLAKLKEWFEKRPDQIRGEFVVIVHGAEKAAVKSELDPEKILELFLAEKLPVKQAASLAAKITGAKKNELYSLALKKIA